MKFSSQFYIGYLNENYIIDLTLMYPNEISKFILTCNKKMYLKKQTKITAYNAIK